MIDRAVVSTDCDEISKVARASGLDAPFLRPAELSGDQVADAAVLTHALEEMERRDSTRYDIVVMLQPTSPLREPEHIEGAIRMLVDGDWDAVWSVSETDSKSHPLKQLTVDRDGLDYYDPAGAEIIARQQLTSVYHRNGVVYVLTRDCLLERGNIKGARTGAFVIDAEMVSIDTMADLERCEAIHKRRN